MMAVDIKNKSVSSTHFNPIVCHAVSPVFLCRENKVRGHTFEYRRDWAEDRLLSLVQSLLLIARPPIYAFAVTNDHTYLAGCKQELSESGSVKHVIMLP
jgi:hypothetical protein